jgi:hypothetical protein
LLVGLGTDDVNIMWVLHDWVPSFVTTVPIRRLVVSGLTLPSLLATPPSIAIQDAGDDNDKVFDDGVFHSTAGSGIARVSPQATAARASRGPTHRHTDGIVRHCTEG